MKNSFWLYSEILSGRWDRNGGSLFGPLLVTGQDHPLQPWSSPNENELKWLARCISASGTPQVVGYRAIYRPDMRGCGLNLPSSKDVCLGNFDSRAAPRRS